MQIHRLSAIDMGKILVIGIITAIVTAGMMLLAIRSGISPLPKPLALAFVQSFLGPVPLPVGFVFHAAWVIFFTFVYVILFRDSLRFSSALGLAFLLWLSVLVIFYPIVGWGLFGLAIGPKMIVASAVPHFVFAILIWGGANLFVRRTDQSSATG